MTMKDIPRRTKLSAELLNRIIRQANRADLMRAGPGLTLSRGNGGNLIGVTESDLFPREPATTVMVCNEGDTDLPALSIAGIIGDIQTTEEDIVSERVLRVRAPKACDAGNIVIIADQLNKGGNVGPAWISGVCLVTMVRWFDSDLLDTIECYAGETYGLATAGGCLDILSELQDDYGNPIIGTEHLAVVRFNHRRYTRWVNKGTTTVSMGDPITRTSTETDGMTDGPGGATVPRFDVLSMKSPKDQAPEGDAYVNVGGDVAAGADGRCMTASDPVLIRTAEAKEAGDAVGAEDSEQSFKSGSSYRVLAALGTSSGSEYAVARTLPAAPPLVLLRIIDGQTCFNDGTTIKYGVQRAGGVITSVTAAFDPNGVGATPGLFTADVGIGRAEIMTPSGFSATLVLVLLDVSSPIDQAILEGEEVWSGSLASVPVVAGGKISAYRLQFP